MDRRKVCVLMVLWAMANLSSPGHSLRALRRTTGGRRGSTGLTGQDANGVPLRRSKRGWMWNQFFLLEEYTGTDMQYVGKVVKEPTFSFFIYPSLSLVLHQTPCHICSRLPLLFMVVMNTRIDTHALSYHIYVWSDCSSMRLAHLI